MSKKKKAEPSANKQIRRLIRDSVWVGRDDDLHGVALAADLIERLVVEAAYQEGFSDAQWQPEGVTCAQVASRHPENYLLVNVHDGTVWGLSGQGRWSAVDKLVIEGSDGVQEEFDLTGIQESLRKAKGKATLVREPRKKAS